MTARTLQIALSAQSRGLDVIPLNAWKRPAIRSAHPEGDPLRGKCRGACGLPGHGVYDATRDPQRLLDLFECAGKASGYGVACGIADQWLIGLDLDRKNGADGVAGIAAIGEQFGFSLPYTITTATPNNGLHVWLAGPAGVRIPNSAGTLAAGIDVRGAGGFLVGPGSWTPKGVYKLAVSRDAPIAPVPPQLLALLLPKPRPPRSDVGARPARTSIRITGLVATVLGAKQGQRNDTLYWAACRMGEAAAEGAIGEAEGRELLLAAAERIGLDCAEASASIDSGFRSVLERL